MRREILFGIIVSVMLLASIPSVSAELFGDANEDTNINMQDVTKIERMILELDSETTSADANQDDKISMGDVTYIELIILERKPFPGGTIIAGLQRDAGGVYGGSHHLSNLVSVFENLVVYGYESEIVPRLATSWEVSDDGLTWIFHLREGVEFHDGTPFNADAARFALEMHNKKRPGHLGPLSSITAIDEYTLQITHTEPFAALLYELAWPFFSMASPAAFDEEGGIVSAIGTGPFEEEEWIPDEELVLVRNENYWGGMPKPEKIILKDIPDPGTRVVALEAGDIDMIIDTGGVLPQDVPVLEANSEVEVLTEPWPCGYYLSLNCKIPPFNDTEVRRAVPYAIDHETIVEDLLEGYGKVAKSILTSDVADWFYPAFEVEYDPDVVRQLLEEAGWTDVDDDGVLEKNGEEFKVIFLVSTASGQEMVAEVIQGQLQEVGIIVEIQVVDSGVYYEVIKEEEGHHILLLGYPFLGPHNVLYRSFHSTGDWNLRGMFYSNPQMDELLERGVRTTDHEERVEIYADVQKIVAEDVPIIPLYEGVLINAVRDDIKGYKLHPWFVVNWEDIYVCK